MNLYLKLDQTLEEAANLIASVALPRHEREIRDGLNLGGGEYFKFFNADSEILLVCNDAEHMEVFVEEQAKFSFYCYARKGGHAILDSMLTSLQSAGVECEIGEEDV